MSCHSNSKQLKLDSLLREVCINTEQVLDDSVFCSGLMKAPSDNLLG